MAKLAVPEVSAPLPTPPSGEWPTGSVSRAQLSALWRVRGKLTLRMFRRERGRIVTAIVVLLIFGPLILGAAFGTAMGYRQLPDQWPTALLGAVLTFLWMIWIVFPVMFGSLNEGADITRVLVYPLQRRTLLAAVLLGTLFDYPTYLMLPLFLAILYGFGLSLSGAAVVVFVALVLSYAHLVMIGQLVGTAVGGLMHSRRLRDITIVLASLLGGLWYFINLGVRRIAGAAGQLTPEQLARLQQWEPLRILRWLPPGAAAQAVDRALAAEWLSAAAWLAYSAAWLGAVVWVWYKLLTRLTTGEGYLTIGWRKAAQERDRTVAARGRVWRLLPDDVAALVRNEWRSVWRVPQRRVALMQGVLMPILFLAVFFLDSDSPLPTAGLRSVPRGAGLGLPMYAVMLFWLVGSNQLAWEGRGLASLLLSPVPRERLFRAKQAALFTVGLLPLLVAGAVTLSTRAEWLTLGGLITAACVGLATLGVMSVASVLFPIPVSLESRRKRNLFQGGGSAKTGCASVTLVPLAVFGFGLPAAAPLIAAFVLRQPAWLIPGVALSAVYGVVVAWAGAKLAARLLVTREPELLATLTLAPEE